MVFSSAFINQLQSCLYAINFFGSRNGATLKEIRSFLFGFEEAVFARTINRLHKTLPKVLKIAVKSGILQSCNGRYIVREHKKV